jgi:hypothetical protein
MKDEGGFVPGAWPKIFILHPSSFILCLSRAYVIVALS